MGDEVEKKSRGVTIPEAVAWAIALAAAGYAFQLDRDVIRLGIMVGNYEQRMKAVEDRKASCESRLDEQGHRLDKLEKNVTLR